MSAHEIWPIVENVYGLAAAGSAATIPDPATATVIELKLTVSPCVLTFPAGQPGRSFLLMLTQDGSGSRTVTWPAGIAWSGGTAPTLTTAANKTDVFTFVYNAQRAAWLGFTDGLNF